MSFVGSFEASRRQNFSVISRPVGFHLVMREYKLANNPFIVSGLTLSVVVPLEHRIDNDRELDL